MNKNSKILITGSNGMLGSALKRYFLKNKYSKILIPSKKELNLLNKKNTFKYFKKNKPEFVFNCAALVGGIMFNNNYPLEFLYKNIEIQNNTIMAAFDIKVKKFLQIGSSCVYPKFAKQPIKEKYLLSGPLEETNKSYALAKISGIFLCQAIFKQFNMSYISAMLTNLYGINDKYHDENSHVITALIKKFHNAKINNKPFVNVWGDGSPKREFLFADDAARALVMVMKKYREIDPINVGSGDEITIKKLVYKISNLIDYKGKIKFNKSFPNGTPRKRLDNSKIINLGFKNNIDIDRGLKVSYNDFLDRYN